jgi:hypothetical protein
MMKKRIKIGKIISSAGWYKKLHSLLNLIKFLEFWLIGVEAKNQSDYMKKVQFLDLAVVES